MTKPWILIDPKDGIARKFYTKTMLQRYLDLDEGIPWWRRVLK